MNWKEQLRKYAADNLNDGEYPIPEIGRMVQLEYAVETLIEGVETEIIEKLIADIPDEFVSVNGALIRASVVKQQLRATWLHGITQDVLDEAKRLFG